MGRSLARSHAHFRRALTRLPLGVSSNFRYWGDDATIYVQRGKGARLWDIDGNEYIDYRLGYGPAILGYADPRVDEAARAGMEIGGVFALATEREAIEQRLSSIEALDRAMNGLFRLFVEKRVGRGWAEERERVRGWIAARGGEMRRAVPKIEVDASAAAAFTATPEPV